jgi:NHLM bacteriocin system secretion protein
MTKDFFRQQALDAASRIEALPHAMSITRPLTRHCVAGLAVALGAAVIWSAYVRVPVQIAGDGVLVDRSGSLVAPVTAASQGYVSDLLVGVGDTVAVGQPLVRLAFPDRELELRKARTDRDAAREANGRRQVLRAAEAASDEQSYRQKAFSLEDRITGLVRKVGWLEQRVKDVAGLEAKGFSSALSLISARVSLEEATDQLNQAKAERSALDTQREQGSAQRERDTLADKLEMERLDQQLAKLEGELANDTVLRADAAGRIAAINTRRGALVAPAQEVAEILASARSDARNLEALLFVPMSAGKRVKPGDRALINPASLPEGSHDQLVATVQSVSDIPISLSTLRNLLGNDQLAAAATKAGPPFMVRASFDAVGDHPGYAWTSIPPPDVTLTPGTPFSARVTVEDTPLLVLAVPALKRFFGLAREGWAGNS